MKRSNNKRLGSLLLRSFAVVLLSVLAQTNLKAQSCNASFIYSVVAPGGVLQFSSTSTPTGSTFSYTWNFPPSSATGTTPILTGTVPVTTNTFSTPGIYPVTLTISNGTTTCNVTSNVIVTGTCSISFTTTPASFTNCNGGIVVSNSTMCTPLTYSWSSNASAPTGSTQGSLCPGTYTVYAFSPTTCPCSFAQAIITVTANTTCSLNAAFVYSYGPAGAVNFTSTSTSTVAGSTYTWSFGDGNFAFTGPNITHTYSSTGPYNAKLIVLNPSQGCLDSSATSVITPTFCTLQASFTPTLLSNGMYKFASTSSGTNGFTQYLWNFGDFQTASGDTVTHQYASSGTYTVTLTATNSSACVSATTMVLNVTVICNVTAGFTHTVGTYGVVNFQNVSVGTGSNSTFFWNFGDGWTAVAPAPTHTYVNAGTHYVTLRIRDTLYNCYDSIIQSINITGIPCVANSGFTLVPSGIPQFYYAIPNYPYNVVAAVWNWGDGNSSTGLYSSHVYSASANYSICLTVTVSCGSTSSYCSSYMINKPSPGGAAAGMYSVNVMSPSLKVGIADNGFANEDFNIFPNPCGEECNVTGLKSGTILKILDMKGSELLKLQINSENESVDLSALPPGLYFILPDSALYRPRKLIIGY
jgi:PKD repeat protein